MKTGLTEVKIGKVTPEVNVYENTQIKTQGNTSRRRHWPKLICSAGQTLNVFIGQLRPAVGKQIQKTDQGTVL